MRTPLIVLGCTVSVIFAVNFFLVVRSDKGYSSSGPVLLENPISTTPAKLIAETKSKKSIETVNNTATTSRTKEKCPKAPIVSVEDGGRLANKIWEYAAVWSVARLLGRRGYVPEETLRSLRKIFANLSLASLSEIRHCKLKLGASVKKKSLLPLDEAKEKFKGWHLLLQKWILLPQPVLLYKSMLKDEFRIRADVLKQVEDTVRKVNGTGRTRIGVHVRRTDFGFYLPRAFNTTLVKPAYFKEAISWYRKNIPGPLIFLVVSDDIAWCRKNLVEQDVVIASKSPEHDLALLSTCDHTIIDYGTYGDWGALMADGHTISLNVDKWYNAVMAESSDKWHVFDENKYK